MPWATLAGSANQNYEELILAGLYEEVRNIEEINIFTFQNNYEGYLSPEQLARELFISTGTVLSRIKNKSLIPDVEVPFGNKKLSYFSPEKVENIRTKLNLKVHDASTMYADFFEFLEKGDYTFSYKIIFLLSFFKHVNSLGECDLDVLTEEYAKFYLERIRKDLPVEKGTSPYKNTEYLNDKNEMKNSLLKNPFEKFERKRFMYHCKDLKLISLSSILWDQLKDNDQAIIKIKNTMENDLKQYFGKLGSEIDF
jgi:hypothetical protein